MVIIKKISTLLVLVEYISMSGENKDIAVDELKNSFGKLKNGKLAGIITVHAEMIKEYSDLWFGLS